MPESNFAIGLVITPAAALMPVRGRITRRAARLAADRSSFAVLTPLDPVPQQDVSRAATPEIVLSASVPAWFASIDPVAQYQFCANLSGATWRPAVSIYA
jgi:hypothetical protein